MIKACTANTGVVLRGLLWSHRVYALESLHLLYRWRSRRTDGQRIPPSHKPSGQRAQEAGGRQRHVSQPRTPWARRGRDRFPSQREPALPQIDVDFKPAERRARFHRLKPPRVWYLLWPLYPPPPSPTPVRSWLLTRLFSMALS